MNEASIQIPFLMSNAGFGTKIRALADPSLRRGQTVHRCRVEGRTLGKYVSSDNALLSPLRVERFVG